MTSRILSVASVVLVVTIAGCTQPPELALQRLMEARRLSAELLLQFAHGADATNRAVMAEDDVSAQGAKGEAERAMQAVEEHRAALGPLLDGLGYSAEAALLEEFGERLARYRETDRAILDLAVANSNIKAQQLSFGAGQESADAVRTALQALGPVSPAQVLRVQALTATALAELRGIQVLQARHIPEASDEVMTMLEQRMAQAEAAARAALRGLEPVVDASSRARLADAATALDRFITLNGEIVALSRRNTDVRSLSLTLGQKRTLIAACDESLRALQAALGKRGLGGTR